MAQLRRQKRVLTCIPVLGTQGVIWNKDAFGLDIGHDGHVPCLWGELRVGDSIHDEWFAVYLLRKLTALFPDLVVR